MREAFITSVDLLPQPTTKGSHTSTWTAFVESIANPFHSSTLSNSSRISPLVPQPIPSRSLTPEPVPSVGSPVSSNSAIPTDQITLECCAQLPTVLVHVILPATSFHICHGPLSPCLLPIDSFKLLRSYDNARSNRSHFEPQ